MDYNEPIEISPNIYWVGRRSDLDFEMNVYLRVFEGNGQKINMLIDPGPSPDFDVISTKVEKVLGRGEPIHLAFINHQDPDVCINTIFFQRHHPGLRVITSEDTWRLIRFYGLKKENFIPVEKFKTGRIKLGTGHKLFFIPTPYAHFRGACALYDAEHSILFSGDLFGGLSKTPDLYADESYWEGVKVFHQIYMPANLALKKAILNFRTMASGMRMIAPQHGKVIKQDLVDEFMTRLESLQVGLDLETSKYTVENYINAFNEILKAITENIDPDIKEHTLAAFQSDGSFPGILTIKDGVIIGLKGSADDSLKTFAEQLCNNLGSTQRAGVRSIMVQTLAQRNIAGDNLCLDNEDNGGSTVNEEKDKVDQLLDELLDF